jgi:putative membrane protein
MLCALFDSEVVEMQDDQSKTSGANNRNIMIAVGGIALLVLLLSGGGMMGMMFMWPLLLIGGIVFSVWLARGGRLDEVVSQFGNQPEDRAHAILRERYARGELTQEQYDEMRRRLQ